MKKTILVSVLLAAAAGMASCTQEVLDGAIMEQPSNRPVMFVTKREVKDTRAAYSGETCPSSGKERIDWEEGDIIHIAADISSGVYAADYEITSVSATESGSSGRIWPYDPDCRLYWGSNGEHHFYAFYNTGSDASDYEVLHQTGVLESSVSPVQLADCEANAAEELEMLAVASARPSDGTVMLSFKPSVTTFQIKLANGFRSGRVMKVQKVSLVCTGEEDPALWGGIRYTVEEDGSVSPVPVATASDGSEGVLSVDMGRGTTVAAGESLTINLFALPKDITDLSLRVKVNGKEGGVRLGRTVGGTYEPLVFEACSKNNLNFTLSGYPFEEDIDEDSPEFSYFNIIPLEDDASITAKHDVYYSTDLEEWTFLASGSAVSGLGAGVPVYFKNEGTEFRNGGKNVVGYPVVGGTLNCSVPFDVAGNVMSLLLGDDFLYEDTLEEPYALKGLFYSSRVVHADRLVIPVKKMTQGAFCYMFANSRGLETPPELPAVEMAPNCYYWMFEGCRKLTSAPELPAMRLEKNCYEAMFMYCTSLAAPPELPATDLAASCYAGMFKNCSSISDLSAWELPATVLAERCYYAMFRESGVTRLPVLGATELANNCYCCMFYQCRLLEDLSGFELPATVMKPSCYSEMFYECASLVLPPAVLPATTLASGCYYRMFMYCRKLERAPLLPADRLEYNCYAYMFNMCSALGYIKMLATDISASNCLSQWVKYVPSSGVFVKSAGAEWTVSGASGIPEGWTVETEG